ncbi:5-formyltetrahydrofolate cyclo-ligase family protein [Novipirellula galeiformis]|uniref:5-formyltetrahydrofolate cyclo-ligase n=2 Tax=Novipirellula galeiformis TaxID=2528004 RepID=A0A5C6CCI5_9BACT|nr:5-formyltetrahydrofolate cyclo-ligase family protein [Novipirellula galeiformis]
MSAKPRYECEELSAMNDAALSAQKLGIRKAAHLARKAQPDKEAVSLAITDRVLQMPEYVAARYVMWYVDARDEARTRQAIPGEVAGDKAIVVPYCADGELKLFRLESMDELEVGMYQILEPREPLREIAAKKIDINQLDLILVPGLGFDARGGRIGHGKGYYDRLLEHAKPETLLVSLAFECQMFDDVPMQRHDIFMDKVVTEKCVYEGIGRRGTS